MSATKRADRAKGEEKGQPTHRAKQARVSGKEMAAESKPSIENSDWIFGRAAAKSEMCKLIKEFDFSKTTLGPLHSWSMSMKMALSMCITSHFSIVIWLGRDNLMLYNDAFRAVCGNKHPRFLACPGREAWSEMWPQLVTQIDSVWRSGEATWMVDHLLPSTRFGFEEETYWTYSYSPILSPETQVLGVFTATEETTARVVGERRLSTLRELSASLSHVDSVSQVCRVAGETMSRNRYDVPYFLLYVVRDKLLRLENAFGAEAGLAAVSPTEVPLEEDLSQQPPVYTMLATALQSKGIKVVDLDEATRRTIGPLAPWKDTPRQEAVIALRTHDSAGECSHGVLVMGLNSHRGLDDNYRTFLSLGATQIASSVANAKAFEEEKRRAKALLELDQAKTTFFSNISHEFRTPLTLMLGPLEDMLFNQASHANLSEAQRVSLSLVHRNSTRLLKLVNMLLDFSRIEAGRMKATYQPVDLCTLTAELASLFRAACDKAQVKLLVNCPVDALKGTTMFVDVDMWEKIVINLLSNAFKFTLNGEIEVRLEQDSQHDNAVLVVRDTGCGIPENEIPRLFERFHRVQGSSGRSHEGTGIGLAFVYELVRLHGGTITVQSKVSQGTTFTVRLPCGSAHLPSDFVPYNSHVAPRTRSLPEWWLDGANDPNIPPAPMASPRHSNPQISPGLLMMGDLIPASANLSRRKSSATNIPAKVLVADDNADMLAYVCRILAGAGMYEIVSCRDGQEALDRLKVMRLKPELVISDIMMPRLDGFGLLKAIREHPDLARIPVIFLSARAGEEARSEGIIAGAEDYLAKPFSAKELLTRVAARVELYRMRSETMLREEKLRKEAEEANAVKDRFLAVLSHELRTPLTPALLLAEEHLLDTTLSTAMREDMSAISRQIRLQVQLIDDLLDVTKIRQGKLRLQLKPMDAHTVLRHTAQMFQHATSEKGLTLSLALEAEQSTALVDSTRLQQIFWNLMGNAVKFSSSKGRIFVTTWNNKSVSPTQLCVSVTDTGIGIDPEALPKLFQAFEQTSHEVTRSFGGLGLGLVISKTLAQLHGGSVHGASPGKGLGATFTLTLPVATAVQRSAAPEDVLHTSSPAVTKSARKLRLLLVEDNPMTVQIMERLLKRLGHEVKTAMSCAEAIKAAGEKGVLYDLALCDIGLPDGSGHDLLRQLRPLQPEMRAIALSGYGREEEVRRSYEMGFGLHLTKPVRFMQVSDAIDEVMAADLR